MTEFVGTMFQTGATPVLEAGMRFNETRHRLILSNIANADTPGYRRQDLDDGRFKKLLGEAIEERDTRHPGRFRMDSHSIVPTNDGWRHDPERGIRFGADEGPLRHDENNVSMEREMALLVRNGGSYQTYARLLSKSYGQIRAAINERAEG